MIQAEIAQLDDEIQDRIGQRRSATIVFLVGLVLAPVGIGLILIPWSLYNYFRHKSAIKRLQEARRQLLSELD